ncbi:MAG TPA: P-loop NTPase [Sandaracinaceae bacterium LLY-WYZ-13_1]|nr:P-loop NTPase [Sandaracinaceae bacterium LLY-WYZ-13_1]
MSAAASSPLCISVGGGKGGVGKSLVAANLAVAFGELGFRTVLVDADLGAANQHTLFGIDHPGSTLQALVDREVGTLEEVAGPTGAPRLFLVPGIGAVPGAANLHHAQKLKVMRHVRRLDAEVVVVDVGAGVSYNVLDFFELGDLRLVVTTPQLTAMQNAYCFMKAAVYRGLKQRVENHAQREAFGEASSRRETERVSELRARARGLDAGLEAGFAQVTEGFATWLVGNVVEQPSQRKVLAALSRMARDFLDVRVDVGATLPMSREVHASVTRRRPFVLSHPDHPASRQLRALAEHLAIQDVDAIRRTRLAPAAEDPSRVGAPSERPSDQERFGVSLIDYLRREERVAVDHAVRVACDGAERRARMNDLSPRGALLEGALSVEVGARLELRLVGLADAPSMSGVVRHVSVSGRHVGLELDERCRATARRLLEDAPRRSSTLPPPAIAAVG